MHGVVENSYDLLLSSTTQEDRPPQELTEEYIQKRQTEVELKRNNCFLALIRIFSRCLNSSTRESHRIHLKNAPDHLRLLDDLNEYLIFNTIPSFEFEGVPATLYTIIEREGNQRGDFSSKFLSIMKRFTQNQSAQSQKLLSILEEKATFEERRTALDTLYNWALSPELSANEFQFSFDFISPSCGFFDPIFMFNENCKFSLLLFNHENHDDEEEPY
ncbi:MAG: hypothetical protein K2P93_01025 [Alphaproteobacteria bacterium]|nr:hypothetical protein [Alphaproteobacteria bacterium]